MTKSSIVAKAPARIDLAGGTVDIWPLYLFHDKAMTVNAAIDSLATVRIAERADGKVLIVSKDRGLRCMMDLRFRGLDRCKGELIARIVKFYEPERGLSITSHCEAPAGAGLGGSSALAVALSSALNRFLERGFTMQFQLDAIRNIETRVLGVPTGVQDYYSALYGGVSALSFGYTGVFREKLRIDRKKLKLRLVLCYTGKERQSGISNWDMVKRFLDGHERVRRAMLEICSASIKMREALLQHDFEKAALALCHEWENRKKLSPKVSNGRIEKLIRSACGAGALAGKVCGAGGGGCIVFIVREGMKRSVEECLCSAGAKILPFRICSSGVSVSGSED